jgi:hypothetical protein
MAVTYPPCYTEVKDAELEVERPVTDELLRKMIQNVNMLSQLAMVGQICAIAVNQPGAPAPNPEIWQACDGSEITDVNSPLQSIGGDNRYTPDLKKKYLRGAEDQELNTITSADLTCNLTHTHTTNVIGYWQVGEGGTERRGYAAAHNHGINNDLSAAEPIDVAHMKVVFYMKIN